MPSPYMELSRADWARLRKSHPLHLTNEDIERVRGLGDFLDFREVEEVYLPLSRLLNFHIRANHRLMKVTHEFLGESRQPTPFIIGVAGSVAVGKSTTARLLQELLRHWDESPKVDLVTTDGFLYPNEVLKKRGLMQRKGFPESFDRRALLRFVAKVKAGVSGVRAPVYSHHAYDILPGKHITVRQPDVLIVEGLNVLQPPPRLHPKHHPAGRGPSAMALSDYFDFSVYVDARESDIRQWYCERFLHLRRTAFQDPRAYFHRFAQMDEAEALVLAKEIWANINLPNLVENILPTRGRANLVLRKGANHTVKGVRLRRI